MYEQKYLVCRLNRDGEEVYWNGLVGQGRKLLVGRTDEAKAFDTAEEAYKTITVLVNIGVLSDTWLDSRVGKRIIAGEEVSHHKGCGVKQGSGATGWGGLRAEGDMQ